MLETDKGVMPRHRPFTCFVDDYRFPVAADDSDCSSRF